MVKNREIYIKRYLSGGPISNYCGLDKKIINDIIKIND
jgi:hypothetical protein